MKLLQKTLFFCSLLLMSTAQLWGQCTNTTQYPASAIMAPTSGTTNISSCNYEGEYSQITGIASNTTYQSVLDFNGYLTVRSGSSSGPVVASGFSPLDWTTTSSADHYVHINTDAACGTASTCRVHDITFVSTTNSCLPPSALSASNPTPSSADLDWTEAQSATNWLIEYGPSGFTQGAGTLVAATAKPYTLPGLMSNTDYDFYVRSICTPGSDSSAWSAASTFTTACSVLSPTYSENFSSYIPACWEEATGGIDATFAYGSSSWGSDGFGNVGSSGAAKYNMYTNTTGQWLISPSIDLSAGPYDLNFDIASTIWNTTNAASFDLEDSIALVISTDNGATWSYSDVLQWWTQGSEPSPTGDNINIDLSAYSGTVRFGFYSVASSASSSDFDIFVDNFLVTTPITCFAPSALSASNITNMSADLDWTDAQAATGWVIEYDTIGFTQGTGNVVGAFSKPYTLTGLMANTNYEFYVRSVCAPGDTSSWAGPFSFTTDCNIYTPPYSEDFTNFPATCWDQATGGIDATFAYGATSWIADGFANVGFSGAAKYNMYNNTTGQWLISPSFDVSGGTYEVSFDIASTVWNGTAQANFDATDSVAFVISTDGGATWSYSNVLQWWTQGSEPSAAGNSISLNLAGYTGTVRFGFYSVASSSTSSDFDLFVDNFAVSPAAAGDIRITEIMYNPPESGQDSLEYIELYNNSMAPVDLQGYSFSQGVAYTFGTAVLAPGDYYVVAVDTAAIQNVFGVSADAQWTSGGLSNGGEDITLIDAFGTTVDSVDYDDGGAWPGAPDSNGPSLMLCDLQVDQNDGANWLAETTSTGVLINANEVLGSPGMANGCPIPDDIQITTFLNLNNNYCGQDSITASMVIENLTTNTVNNAPYQVEIVNGAVLAAGNVNLMPNGTDTITVGPVPVFVGTEIVRAFTSLAGDADNTNDTLSQQVFVSKIATTMASSSDVTCNGGANGSATVSATDGLGTYTYAWSPSGQTTATATGLMAGTYTVLVTDSIACSSSSTVTITEPTAIAIAPGVVNNATCNGDTDGSIDISVSGGTSPYSFSWSNGATTEDISGLSAGAYTGTVTDDIGCTMMATVTITEPSAISVTPATVNNISCNGDSTGLIDISVSGGTSPYSFSWSNGATTEDLSALAAGAYTGTVTDDIGCSVSATITITEPAVIALSPNAIANVSCNGDTDGSIDISVSGGTSPYSFSWSNGATTEDLTGIAAGAYSGTITDDLGCSISASLTITEPSAVSVTPANVVDLSCNGDSNGSIDIDVSGGTSPYSFAWSNGATTEDLNGLMAGTYTGTVTDDAGCVRVAAVTVTEPTAVTALITDNNDGTATASATGGTVAGSYTYAWDNGQTTATATALVDGSSYCVSVTDDNNCLDTACAAIVIINVQDLANAATIQLFPNPTTGNVFITLGWDSDVQVQIDVFDLTGQVVASKQTPARTNQVELNLDGLPAGMYTVRFLVDDQVATKRLILQRP